MKLGNRSLFWNHEGDAVCSSRWAPRFHTTPDSTLRQISRARRFHTSPGWRSSKIDLQSRLSLSSRTAARPGSPRPQKMSISWRLFFSITQHLFFITQHLFLHDTKKNPYTTSFVALHNIFFYITQHDLELSVLCLPPPRRGWRTLLRACPRHSCTPRGGNGF